MQDLLVRLALVGCLGATLGVKLQDVPDPASVSLSSLNVTGEGALVIDNALVDFSGRVHVWLTPAVLDAFKRHTPACSHVDFAAVDLAAYYVSRNATCRTNFWVGPKDLLARHCVEVLMPNWVDGKTTVLRQDCFTHVEVHLEARPSGAFAERWSSLPHHAFTTLMGRGRDPNFANWNNEVLLPMFATLRDYRASVGAAASGGEAVQFAVSPPMQSSSLGLYSTTPVVTLEETRRATYARLVIGLSDRLNMYWQWKRRWSEPSEFERARDGFRDFRATTLPLLGLPTVESLRLARRPAEPPRVLWMQRTATRCVSNPEAVYDAWTAAGAKVSHIVAGRSSLADMVRALWSNDIVFGVHGADFSNTVYMPPAESHRSLVVQLINCGYMLRHAVSDEPQYYGAYAMTEGHLYLQFSLGDLQSCGVPIGQPDSSSDYLRTMTSLHHTNFTITNTKGLTRVFRAATAYYTAFESTESSPLGASWHGADTLRPLQERFCGTDTLCERIGFY